MVEYVLVAGVSGLREQLKFILDVSVVDRLRHLIKKNKGFRDMLDRNIGFNEVVHVLVLPHNLVTIELVTPHPFKDCMQK